MLNFSGRKLLRNSVLLYSIFFLLAVDTACYAQIAVTTYHNDISRTGANLNETILNTGNVNVSGFGKLFSLSVDGDIYAQPLYLQNVAIPNQGTHNVVYVATENDSVYAFDADSNTGTTASPLWFVNFTNAANGITPVPAADIEVDGNIRNPGPIGITGTPVIDPTSNTIYLVARTKENGAYFQRLHALDVTTGAEKFGGPVVISASVAGTGATNGPNGTNGNTNGQVTFDPLYQNQRLGLALSNNTVYIGWGSHDDILNYNGWLMGYDATTLKQTGVFNSTPNGSQGGIWQSGQSPAIDASGNVYLMTGNGTTDVMTGGNDYGSTVLKLQSRTLSVVDWFTPHDYTELNNNDQDLSSAGLLLVPGTNLLVGGGKTGTIYVMNTSTGLGGYNSTTDKVVQEINIINCSFYGCDEFHGSPSYFNSPVFGPVIYYWGEYQVLQAYKFNGSTFNTTPVSQGSLNAPGGSPGGFTSVSANVSNNVAAAGSGIVWATLPSALDADADVVGGVLRAYDASNLATELWDSRMNAARDDFGNLAKFTPPTIANGKVYVATQFGQVVVYGLNPPAPSTGSGWISSSASLANLTTEGTADWVHWGDGALNRKAGVAAQISNYTAITTATVSTYSGDPRPLSWSDGAPTVSSASNTNGVSISSADPGGSGIESTPAAGFAFTAPADTANRVLTVHVGGYQSGGKLVAHLSDGSETDFVDQTPTADAWFDRTYTISYTAASAGQTINVSWTMLSGPGYITLSGAALSAGSGAKVTAPTVTTQAAASITASTATLNGAVNTNGATTTAWFQYGTTNPGTCSSSFGTATSTTSIISGSSAAAVTAPLTNLAASTTYYYCAIATNSAGTGLGSVLSFTTSGSGGTTVGSLTGSGTSATTTVNLTTEGSADWIHWGDASLNRKAAVTPLLSTYSVVGSGTAASFGDDKRPASWTDGTPTVSSASDTSGLYVIGTGNGFSFTAPATTSSQTLTVHVGGWASGGTFTAKLSDGSAANYQDVTTMVSGQYDRNYTISYNAASAGQTLTVTWVMNTGFGNVTMDAAALVVGVSSTAAPVVTTTAATSVGAAAATLNGTVNPKSLATTGWFQYGTTNPGTCSSSFGTSTATTSVGAGSAAVATSQALTGLSSGTTYYYCAVGSNSAGTTYGAVQSFATSAAPVVTTAAATSIGSVSATLNGTVNPESLASTGWFQYGSTNPGICSSGFGTATASSSVGSGATAAALSQALTGLSPGTTYYYCAVGSNTVGTTYGTVQSFTTTAAPVVATTAATSIGSVSATLNGTVNPESLASTGWFQYGSTNPGTCTSSFGTATTSASVGSGSTAAALSQALSGLSPATTYYYCAVGSNSVGVTYGAVQSFTTTSAPLATTVAASSVGSTTASLNGTVNPESLATTGWFQYGSTNPGTCSSGFGTTTASSSLGSGAAAVAFTQALTGLSAGTTYYYCAVGSNSVGVTYGAVQNFTTTSAPLVTTAAAATIGSTTATLNGAVNPESLATTAWFEYSSTNPGSCSSSFGTATSTSSVGSGSTAAALTQALTGLNPGTTYYYCAIGSNSVGVSYGNVQSFTTEAAPVVATSAATTIGSTTATLNGSVNPESAATTAYFEYSSTQPTVCSTSFGTATASSSVGSGAAAVAVTQALTGLTPATTYYYCVIGSNSIGVTLGTLQSFTTSSAVATGSLAGSVTTVSTAANLTTVGTTDWIHWGDSSTTSINRKSGVTAALSTYSLVAGTAGIYGDDPRALSWTDGTPTVSSTTDTKGVYVPNTGSGFTFTAPADTTTRHLTIYVGGWSSGGTLTATLSDGSAASYVSTNAMVNGQYDRNYTITYNAASAGQTLIIKWTMNTGYGNVTIDGAALH